MKKLNRGRLLTALAVGMLLVGTGVGLHGIVEAHAHANAGLVSTTQVTESKPLDVRSRATVSRAAGHLLKHLYRARLAVAKKDKKKALHHIQQAVQLSRIIGKLMPTYDVHTHIAAGGLVYDDTDRVQPLLVPLYEELDRLDFIAPLRAARRQSKTRGVASQRKDSSRDAVVSDADFEDLVAEMDVRWATTRLWTAKYFVDHDRWADADRSLREGLDSVDFRVDVVAMPLAKVADNIALARDLLAGGHARHAVEALDTAARSLDRYNEQVGPERQKQVQALRKKIVTLRDQMASRKKALSKAESAAAAQKAQGWWNNLLPWRGKDICVADGGGKSQQCLAR